jgi:ParB family transcriptional regulator, chromosome partitioning protein
MHFRKPKSEPGTKLPVPPVIPAGTLKRLNPDDVVPSRNNPRQLFDKAPLHELLESIRQHGDLVPITAFPLKGQNKYGILDGERR